MAAREWLQVPRHFCTPLPSCMRAGLSGWIPPTRRLVCGFVESLPCEGRLSPLFCIFTRLRGMLALWCKCVLIGSEREHLSHQQCYSHDNLESSIREAASSATVSQAHHQTQSDRSTFCLSGGTAAAFQARAASAPSHITSLSLTHLRLKYVWPSPR